MDTYQKTTLFYSKRKSSNHLNIYMDLNVFIKKCSMIYLVLN